ncbi:MAG: hypothetical protein APF76_10925 [Desulfitibacter sp. BRH_c19]|nr:MAG: hypothetical protein APF76_10925 [Desulfitibacter sp. BRH_c19]
MQKRGRFIFDERPLKKMELDRLIKLSYAYHEQMLQLFEGYRDNDFKRIIDVGAGTGHTTVLLKQLFPDAEVTYCDMSENLFDYSRKLIQSHGLQVNFTKDDILNPVDIKGKYDLVFCRFALKHMFDPIGAVKNMADLLKKKGVMILIDKDVSSNIWFPKFPLYKSSYMDALNKYNQHTHRGGDSFIGRKLPFILKSLSMTNIHTNIIGKNIVEDDNKVYREIMLEVYRNLVPELTSVGYISEQDAHADIDQLENFLNTEGNVAIIFDFIVTGVKK